jgi:bifunctional DNA-binding transcriptional regulator/antitoxin component of YhaV-PrlF toxin-antitoxin module
MVRRNANGTTVRYLQLAHNHRDPETKRPTATVLYNFGREDQVDREAIRRLVRSLSRLLSPQDAAHAAAEVQGVTFSGSRPLGGAWVLDAMWRHLHLDRLAGRLWGRRKFHFPVERLLFALVAARALAPDSKLAMEDWVAHDVVLPGLDAVEVHDLYQVMDLVGEAGAELQRLVFAEVADLLNLEVDLLFFDTTNVYFCRDEPDRTPDGKKGFRALGHSKEKRDDLPIVSIGLAVTREGIPVRCWCWPGNTTDVTVIPEVKRDLIGWKLGRVITVIDRGFTSEANLRTLQRAGGHFIAGEKLRSGQAEIEAALARAGRYQSVRDNVEIKEIVVGDGEARRRFVLVRNPREVQRDRRRRQEVLTEVREALAALPDKKTQTKDYLAAVERLQAYKRYRPYLTLGRGAELRIDAAKVRAAERLDGKYLISTSDDTLSAEDAALGYRQLLEVERCFRTLKTTLELRPVYHRLESRIRSHVVLCWLALLLARICEEKTGRTWDDIRQHMQRLQVVAYQGPAGQAQQCTEPTPEQSAILTALGAAPPPRIFALAPAGRTPA